jgi:two-component system phosphate regulon sensor histidine kinase PhoR
MNSSNENAAMPALEQASSDTAWLTRCDQEVLRTLFNTMAEGVLLLDLHCQVRLLNNALAGLVGVNRAVEGLTVSAALGWPELDQLVRRIRREKNITGVELRPPQTPDLVLQVNASRFGDTAGPPEGILLVFHDISRLKQLENTRQEFVANVSHELRTPLSLIKGYIETLLDGACNDPAIATRFLQTIDKHVDRLSYLIEDLLTISRLESGQIVLNTQPVALRAAVNRVLDDLETRARAKSTRLSNQIPPELTALADADRLQQVLYNLIENAVKYGRAGGHVVVGGHGANGRKVQLWIQDDGPGIPPEAKARIFERFYRVDRARSRETGGTGLGLAIVKHIIQVHGGEVGVESEVGKGATFYFSLPKA